MFPALKVFVEFCGDKDIELAVPTEVSCHLAWSGEAVNAPTIPLPAGAEPFDVSSAFRAVKKVAVEAPVEKEAAPTPKKRKSCSNFFLLLLLLTSPLRWQAT
jgi:hypothetical protein